LESYAYRQKPSETSEPASQLRFAASHPKPMPEIKLNVTTADLARLNDEANAAGIPRAHLIRQRALGGGGVAGLTTAAYHALVADACAFMRGDLNRRHVETLVAYVIAHSHPSQATAGDQSAA